MALIKVSKGKRQRLHSYEFQLNQHENKLLNDKEEAFNENL